MISNLVSSLSNKKNKTIALFAICLIFIVVNSVYLVSNSFIIAAIPFAIIFILAFLLPLDKLFLITVFFTPLSLNISEIVNKHISPDLSIPTEPYLAAILFVVFLKALAGFKFDPKFIQHPITVVVILSLIWIGITAITSTIPVVSFKFLLARLWFVIPIYFLGNTILNQPERIVRFIWLYTIPFILVIGYTLYQHSQYNFAERPANWVVKPFYNDHTSYGAILAMYIPVLCGFLFMQDKSKKFKLYAGTALIIFIVATIFSYTRASWVSLAAAIAMGIVLRLKIPFKTIFTLLIVGLISFFAYREMIVNKLEQNNVQSSDNLTEHVQSISNISSDASNKERINRWNCAIRMFQKKPIFGYGPGTYSFQYAPFQLRHERTIISTDHGDGGNAHSEFLGPLAESGIFGILSFSALFIYTLGISMNLYYKLTEEKNTRILVSVLLLGLITYYIHGCMNNFLDTDKASIPFWGFTTAIVALDLRYKAKQKAELT